MGPGREHPKAGTTGQKDGKEPKTMFYPTIWRAQVPQAAWDDVFSMRREVDRLLDRYFTTGSQQSLAAWTPVVDVRENDEEISVSAELPGLTAADVNVTVQNGILTISGEKKDELQEGKQEAGFHVYERRYGRFERSFTLPRTVIADDVRAQFTNGVLSITLPKSAEAKPRRIQVHGAGNATQLETTSRK
jgi:HSP20 family protein